MIPRMDLIALSMVMATAFGLLVSGRRYLRGYVAKHGTRPPATWMFHRSDDPELEGSRRVALALLPFFLVAGVIYLARPGP
jgi:hypothetical protein